MEEENKREEGVWFDPDGVEHQMFRYENGVQVVCAPNPNKEIDGNLYLSEPPLEPPTMEQLQQKNADLLQAQEQKLPKGLDPKVFPYINTLQNMVSGVVWPNIERALSGEEVISLLKQRKTELLCGFQNFLVTDVEVDFTRDFLSSFRFKITFKDQPEKAQLILTLNKKGERPPTMLFRAEGVEAEGAVSEIEFPYKIQYEIYTYLLKTDTVVDGLKRFLQNFDQKCINKKDKDDKKEKQNRYINKIKKWRMQHAIQSE